MLIQKSPFIFLALLINQVIANDTCIGRNTKGECIKLFTEIAPNDYHWITTCADQDPETPLSECKFEIQQSSLGDMTELKCLEGESIDNCRSLKKRTFVPINGHLESRIFTITTCLSSGNVKTCNRYLVETNMNGKNFSNVYER